MDRLLPDMNDAIELLFFKTWWSWSGATNEPYTWTDIACRSFNFVEAVAWITFAALVLIRWRRHRRSNLELWYALAFVLFGISDVIEAWSLTSWLLWWKGANLVTLFQLRRHVMRQFYPAAKLY